MHLLTKCCLIGLVSIFMVLAEASDFDYWSRNFEKIDLFNSSASPAKCHQTLQKNVSLTPQQNIVAIAQECVESICGSLKLAKEPKTSESLADGLSFSKKFKDEIANAVKNVAREELAWLKAQGQELLDKRPFKDLTTEEKIMSTLQFSANRNPRILEGLTLAESLKLQNLLNKIRPFEEHFSRNYEKNRQELSKKSMLEVRADFIKLNAKIKERFGSLQIVNDLNLMMQMADGEFKILDAAKSDYYKANALEQYVRAKTLVEALINKQQWEADLVDLGNLGQDFPSLSKAVKKNSINVSSSVGKALNECTNRLGARRSNLPTHMELEAIQSVIDNTKTKIRSRFFSKLSAHSRGALEDVLSKVEINLPPAQESYEAAFKAKLTNLAVDKYTLDPKERRVTFIYDFGSVQNYGQFMVEDCDYGILAEGHDHFLPAYDKINLSEIIKSPELTAEVTAHEVFHALDTSINLMKLSSPSEATFSKIKNCLLDFHNKDNFYLQEDWADAGASLVVSELSTNSWCPYIQKYGMVSISPARDNHSPAILRLLHQQVYKAQGLPKICTQFLSSGKNPPQIKKCM